MREDFAPNKKNKINIVASHSSTKGNYIEQSEMPYDYGSPEYISETYAMTKFNSHHNPNEWLITYTAHLAGMLNSEQNVQVSDTTDAQ